jgi:CHAT domain-containing protein
LTKAEALQQAQQAMWAGRLKPSAAGVRGAEIIPPPGSKPVAPPYIVDPARPYAHPYYWSAFVLYGNWR